MIFITTFAVSLLLFPLYIRILLRLGCVEYNYKKTKIPIGVGFFIFFVEAIILFIHKDSFFLSYWIFLLIIVLVGILDDYFGEKNIKGFSGHIKVFFQGKITSGLIKAVTGGVIALIISIMTGNDIYNYIINFLLIALMINAINLFDLRPGRAMKVFFIFFMILGVSTTFLTDSKAGIVLFGVLLHVFYYDINGKIMLGDSGSNLLGLHLGIWYCEFIPISYKSVIVFFLIFLHIYVEMYSISNLINNNRVLKTLDLWGARKT